MAGIVDETAGGAGGAGASDVSEPESRDAAASPETPEPAEKDAAAAETPAEVEAEAEDDGASAPTPAPAPRKRRIAVVLICAALALIIDITSKALVVSKLQDRGPVHVPGGFLNFVLIRNSGAAFSIGEGQTWVFTLIAAAVVFVILRVSRNLRSLPWAIALGLLLGGALGNLSDRLFRAPGVGRGDVVDFLQFPTFPLVHYDFPVFNLADTSIVIGGCLMVLLSFLGMQPDGTRHKDTSA